MKIRKANKILIVAAVIVVFTTIEVFADITPVDYRYKLTFSSLSELEKYDGVGRTVEEL